jgi:hypothetical protein
MGVAAKLEGSMWHLVFPRDCDGLVCRSSHDSMEDLDAMLRFRKAAVENGTCRYHLMKTEDLSLLDGPRLPDLIADGTVPQPCFRMLADGEEDGWTDPWVLEQLGRK